jgi:seryl-tRNA synthetase
MIDLKLLERNFDTVSQKLKLKGVDESILNEIKNLFLKKK